MIFEHRNSNLTNLHKAADYLSRSLRENLEIFSVDTNNSEIKFVSESAKMITCKFEQEADKITLDSFMVENVEDILNPENADDKVSTGISSFIGSLREDRYDRADVNFDSVLWLFE